MADIGSIASTVGSYARSGAFWIIIAVVVCILFFFFYAYMSRRSKLKYNCLEAIPFGNGKVGLNTCKAGVFKSKVTFFGLIDYGAEYVVKTNTGKVIQKARTSHLHDLWGKKGFICVRKPDDPKILLPISKAQFGNNLVMFDIAPADYRDASTRIFKEAVEETKGTWEKILPYVMVGLVVIMTIINVVVNSQMTNHTTDRVGDMLIQGCTNQANTGGGQSP